MQISHGANVSAHSDTVHYSRRVVALPRPEANSSSAGARARAEFAPGAPGTVLPHLIGVLPHAVTFVAPLQRRSVEIEILNTKNSIVDKYIQTPPPPAGKRVSYILGPNIVVNVKTNRHTFPGAHSVPSRGGPFLVLQK